MIRLGGLFPEHLNLNGDFGNLDVLKAQLEWRGLSCETVKIERASDLTSDLDFIFVGHGSVAAWSAIHLEFEALAPTLRLLLEGGTPGLAISTGFEELVRTNVFTGLEATTMATRTSKFEVYKDGDNEVLGYLNTDVNLPILHRERNWVASMLHGPILAKNPFLLEEVLGRITSYAGVQLPVIYESEKAGQLADLIDEVWKLEKELASE